MRGRDHIRLLWGMCLTTVVASGIPGCHPAPVDARETVEAVPVPDNLRVRSLGVRGAELGFRDRSGGKASFSIERQDPGEETFQVVGTKPPGVTLWEDWGLMPDSVYHYRVRAQEDGRVSSPSTAVQVQTDPTVVPEPRVTVFDPLAVSPGATLFNVEDRQEVHSTSVIMAVDEEGKVIWHFEHASPLITETDLFDNGDILAQVGPAISRVERNGDLVWYIDDYFLHHDVDVLPWGNILAITSVGLQEKGDDPTDAYSRDWIIEFDPVTHERSRIIHMEFLIPKEDICLACIGSWVTGGDDWMHTNALEYDLTQEALYVSVRNLNRIYKLSYPEGEIQWVMGDGGDFGAGLFSHQHNPHHLDENHILLFDNGLHRDPLKPDRSRVIEIEYDPQTADARIVWEYDGPPPFFSEAQGDATRLPNGNTLIVDSFGPRILEISPDGMPVWELTLPAPYLIYKAHRIENFP